MMEMSDENFALLLISTKHHVRLIVLLFCGFISMNAWAPYQHDFDYFSNISFLLLQIEYIVKVEKYWYCAVESLSEIFSDTENTLSKTLTCLMQIILKIFSSLEQRKSFSSF